LPKGDRKEINACNVVKGEQDSRKGFYVRGRRRNQRELRKKSEKGGGKVDSCPTKEER